LIKQPCEVCGNLKAQAHHDDYSKPLQVRWLCQKHHTEHHQKGGL
jgi:ribosomal protein S27AE